MIDEIRAELMCFSLQEKRLAVICMPAECVQNPGDPEILAVNYTVEALPRQQLKKVGIFRAEKP